MAYVFGYGSLMVSGTPARLRGWSRAWNVAMDNRITLPGYKYYVASDGSRPAVYVTFLNLVPGDGVDGVVVEADLDELDARERNYARIDVSDAVDAPGPVWAYVGLDEAVERFEAGLGAGRAVVTRGYLDSLGGVARPPALPVLDLTRVDVPA